jgi:3-hydroxy-9,10-secoandrosta-1,3,5(10)-triene-9,17-dione monooxygenase reductase component
VIPTDVFRGCIGEFATGVTVVTAEHDGMPAGMTLNAFTSVSLEPLLVLVSLAHGSRTLYVVRESGQFAVSVLKREQREAAIAFSTPGAAFPSEYVKRTSDGFLVVDGAAATQHCRLSELIPAGDHDLVLGLVTGITHNGGEPLIFHRGRFGGMVTDTVVPPGHPIALEEGAGW